MIKSPLEVVSFLLLAWKVSESIQAIRMVLIRTLFLRTIPYVPMKMFPQILMMFPQIPMMFPQIPMRVFLNIPRMKQILLNRTLKNLLQILKLNLRKLRMSVKRQIAAISKVAISMIEMEVVSKMILSGSTPFAQPGIFLFWQALTNIKMISGFLVTKMLPKMPKPIKVI